ncbi:MAG: hypothetical protein WCS96_03320 [Victivallales bacterium]
MTLLILSLPSTGIAIVLKHWSRSKAASRFFFRHVIAEAVDKFRSIAFGCSLAMGRKLSMHSWYFPFLNHSLTRMAIGKRASGFCLIEAMKHFFAEVLSASLSSISRQPTAKSARDLAEAEFSSLRNPLFPTSSGQLNESDSILITARQERLKKIIKTNETNFDIFTSF